ncbi:hypothetical protein MKW94_026255 [Papaver nudicaule]|uniref:Uncharacterized protein n=1 Tax=Papaver nudicaule TaxID=74823 RepID=A0AA41VHG0_PAPNU|nr:hypothetical protein [Papaver nudicaule]
MDPEHQLHDADDEEKWVYDSSLDHKGRVPLRSSTGAWKAALFVVVMHQDLKTAVKNVNYWSGVTTLMPLLGAFLADAYFGRFSMILISSVVYLLGLGLLTMSEVIPSLKPCDNTDSCHEPKKLHGIVFFLALYLISFGTGGHKPSLESFGADQFDDNHAQERMKKMSYFNWWNFALCSGLFLGVTVIVYVQDEVSWAIADMVLTCSMALSIVLFLLGKRFYRYRVPEGSPLTPMLQVLVAAISKRGLPNPSNPGNLYEIPNSENTKGSRLLCHTSKLSFLDKAAILEEEEYVEENEVKQSIKKKRSPWRLATVTKVEELKLVINLIPIWLSTLAFGLCVAQATTFFIKQAATMDRKMGNFVFPPASIYSIAAIAMLISVAIYDRIIVPILRKVTGNERGISILQRIGIGMVLAMVSMIISALVERKRLKVVDREILNGPASMVGPVSMSAFWLAPQLITIGIGDGFAIVGLQEYFYDQVPDKMRSLGIAFYLSVLGASNFLSSFLITIIDHLTERGGRKSWFGKDLNHSRLDKFYWLLAAINGVNLLVYMYLARRYSYKNVEKRVAVTADSSEDERHGTKETA